MNWRMLKEDLYRTSQNNAAEKEQNESTKNSTSLVSETKGLEFKTRTLMSGRKTKTLTKTKTAHLGLQVNIKSLHLEGIWSDK